MGKMSNLILLLMLFVMFVMLAMLTMTLSIILIAEGKIAATLLIAPGIISILMTILTLSELKKEAEDK